MPASEPLRVAYVSPAWPPWVVQNGIATYVGNVREALAGLGMATGVIARATALPDAGEVAAVRDESVRSWASRLAAMLRRRLAPASADYVHAALDIVGAAVRLQQRWPYDLLEMEESFGLCARVRRALRTPLVVRLHGPWFLTGASSGVPEDERFRARLAWEGRGILGASAVSAPTRVLLDAVQRFYGRELACAEVVPNPGPPIREALAWAPRHAPRQLVHVGRFERLKGSDVVVDAFARLAARFPDLELLLVGPDLGIPGADGRLRKAAEFVQERRLPGQVAARIRILGPQPPETVGELRRAAAATIVASRYENFPMAILEAMADGCPVVATAVGGIPELIDDGDNGRLVPPGDPEALAAVLQQLLTQPAHAAALGARARERYRATWAPPVVARRMLDFYRRVAAHCGVAAGAARRPT